MVLFPSFVQPEHWDQAAACSSRPTAQHRRPAQPQNRLEVAYWTGNKQERNNQQHQLTNWYKRMPPISANANNEAPGEPDRHFRLDPASLPQRLELELPEELLERLRCIARETGRSAPELIQELICNHLKQQARET